jgi:aminopeptidase N
MNKVFTLLVALSMLGACRIKSKLPAPQPRPVTVETLDEIKVGKASPIAFRSAATKYFDIVHSRIDITPQWNTSTIDGTVTHKIQILSNDGIDSIVLDAKVMQIKEVLIDAKATPFMTTKKHLLVATGHLLQGKKIELQISFTANPNAKEKGGSASISDDRGFYFINPTGKEKYKPTQAWTQGETESNSCWFPTVDKPNHKSTFDILITVPNRFTTLSNGTLISKIANNNASRTDYWQQKLPMSAYLVMVAIGDYAKVPAPTHKFALQHQFLDSLAIDYYVEPAYSATAPTIFKHTPEMIDFYSTILQCPFPWQKYSQITARDYVSGAMENTSASLFGDFVQGDARACLDRNYEGIVAHELFHQWFGDLVTCESWSHLTMNEGFASYGEHLWTEHKYGAAQAERNTYGDIARYLDYSEDIDHAPVFFYYKDKEDMFNPIIYRKGARILHLLRYELGDTIFFRGLGKFLNQYRGQNVEADQLRLVMEEVSGRDLRLFWNQWYYRGGHPNLHFAYEPSTSSSGAKNLTIHCTEHNDSNYSYVLPLSILLVGDLGKMSVKTQITKKETDISYDVSSICSDLAKLIIYPDIAHTLIGKVTEEISTQQRIEKFKNTQSYIEKRRVLDTVWRAKNNFSASEELLILALKDKEKDIRKLALEAIDWNSGFDKEYLVPIIEGIIRFDDSKANIAAAINLLRPLKLQKLLPLYLEKCKDSSYNVARNSLSAVHNLSESNALSIIHQNKYSFDELTVKYVELLTNSQQDSCVQYYKLAAEHHFDDDRIQILASLHKSALVSTNIDYARSIVDILVAYAATDDNEDVRKSSKKMLTSLVDKFAKRGNTIGNMYADLAQSIQAQLRTMEASTR